MSWVTVYLFMKLDTLNGVFGLVAFLSGGAIIILSIGYFLYYVDSINSERERTASASLISMRSKVFPVFIIAYMLHIFSPTTRQAAVVYLLPKVVGNEQVQALPENFVKLLNSQMESWIEEALDNSVPTKETSHEHK